MKSARILLLSGLTLLATACATGDGEKTAPADSSAFDAVLADAKTEYARADETGFAWRDTKKLMDEAEKAMQEGDAEKAIKLAKKAMKQSKAAQEQAEQNRNAGPRYE